MNKITLKTLHEATLQQIFDQVATHLLTQNAQSGKMDDDGQFACLYRSEHGLKCAAGCLIADDEYHPKMEGDNWYELMIGGLVPTHFNDEIRTLQRIHDEHDPEAWPNELKKFATEHGLSTTIVEQFK